MTKEQSRFSYRQAFKSAACALFGVQSESQRKQDFDSDSPVPFILAGLILVIGFIMILLAIVNSVLD